MCYKRLQKIRHYRCSQLRLYLQTIACNSYFQTNTTSWLAEYALQGAHEGPASTIKFT